MPANKAPHIVRMLLSLPNFLGIIILTDLAGSPSLSGPRNIVSLSKRAFFQNNRLIREIIDQDRHVREQLLSCTQFSSTMRPLYKAHRESGDFHTTEEAMDKEALRVVEAYARTQALPEGAPKGFQARIDHAERPLTNLRNFRKKLLGRRIALGLCQLPISAFPNCFQRKDKWIVIKELLKQEAHSFSEHNLRDLINTHLCLSLKEDYRYQQSSTLPITREERAFICRLGPKVEALPEFK